MPTAGRLTGAIVFAFFGWYMAGIAGVFFPNESPPTYFIPTVAAVGGFLGWTQCGGRAGMGYRAAIGSGLTTGFCLGFCAIFIVGGMEMIENSLDMEYGSAMQAVAGIFVEMLSFAQELYDIPLIVTLFVGGVICALVTEYVDKRLP